MKEKKHKPELTTLVNGKVVDRAVDHLNKAQVIRLRERYRRVTQEELLDVVKSMDASKVTSGMGFEKVVRNACKKAEITCIRTDYKNNVPDFLISAAYGQYLFLECKYYGAHKHKRFGQVLDVYIKKQRKQFEAFKKLAIYSPVYFLTVSQEKDETKPRVVLSKLTRHGAFAEVIKFND